MLAIAFILILSAVLAAFVAPFWIEHDDPTPHLVTSPGRGDRHLLP